MPTDLPQQPAPADPGSYEAQVAAVERPSAPSIPIPVGGFLTNGHEAEWLTQSIAMRLSETLRSFGVNVGINTVSLHELLLLSLNSASKRGSSATLREAQRMREALEKIANLIVSEDDHAAILQCLEFAVDAAITALTSPVKSADGEAG